MGKRRYSVAVMSVAVIVVLVVTLLMTNSLRRSSRITLPDAAAQSSEAEKSAQQESGLTEVAVTPETVQAAVGTLTRPESYMRTLSLETQWSGGSRTILATVTVSGKYTRTDLIQADGRVRHAITNGEQTYVWYNTDKTYYTGPAGDISADDEQHIPTYEDILNLNANQITTADYRDFSNTHCIYVETAEDEDGYVLRYWVSVESGLLVGAEKLQNGSTVYQVEVESTSEEAPGTADFTLPDGTILLRVES